MSLIWGRNVDEDVTADAITPEAAYQITPLDQVYGRAEWVQKDFFLLRTKQLPPSGAPHRLAGIYAFTGGYLHDFRILRGLDSGVAGDVTLYGFPKSLEPAYGSFPLSVHLFLRLRWGRAAKTEMEVEMRHPM